MRSLLLEVRSQKNLYAAWLSVRSNITSNGTKESKAEIEKIYNNLPSYINNLHIELRRGFKFSLQKGIVKARKGKSPRPIVVSTIKDRIVQRAILNILQTDNVKIKSKLGNIPGIFNIPTSVGGIPKKGVPNAITLIKMAISNGSKYYIKSDIKNFFTKIPKDIIIQYIISETKDEEFAALISAAITTELSNKSEISNMELFPIGNIGVAQGGSLSALAGNIVLQELDNTLNDRGITLIRYLDDFVILGKSANYVRKAFLSAQKILDKLGMHAYQDREEDNKYKEGNIIDGFDFLGCTITPDKVMPSKDAQLRIINKIKKTIFDSKDSIKQFETGEKRRHLQNTLIQSLSSIDRQIKGCGDALRFCTTNQPFIKLDRKLDKIIFHYLYQQLKLIRTKDQKNQRRMLGISLLQDTIMEL